jgi:cytoskeleton protein RodZ
MTNDIQPSSSTEHKPVPFGSRLQTARESLGLERRDAAAQLRLNEKVIIMMEKDRYPADLPVTFIRGYIRAYGKLLQIPEYEIKKAIEPIKPKPATQSILLTPQPLEPITSSNYFMQFFTYLIVITLIGLVGMWWYSHSSDNLSGFPTQLNMNMTPIPPVEAPAIKPPSENLDTANKIADHKPIIKTKPKPAPAPKEEATEEEGDVADNAETNSEEAD